MSYERSLLFITQRSVDNSNIVLQIAITIQYLVLYSTNNKGLLYCITKVNTK